MTINCKGALFDLSQPVVMGILNLTPDSFSDGGKWNNTDAALKRFEAMAEAGAAIIDIGGMSTRPGAVIINEQEEINRVVPVVKEILKRYPAALLSIDTSRSSVAKACVEAGAAIINDVSAGMIDNKMIATVASLRIPYILMHHRGIPASRNPEVYSNIATEVFDFLQERITLCRKSGISDLMIDPGFGFGKDKVQNFELLARLETLSLLGLPMVFGVSRKRMITETLGIGTADADNGTTALNTIGLMKGAKVLRVHDVKKAVEAVKLFRQVQPSV